MGWCVSVRTSLPPTHAWAAADGQTGGGGSTLARAPHLPARCSAKHGAARVVAALPFRAVALQAASGRCRLRPCQPPAGAPRRPSGMRTPWRSLQSSSKGTPPRWWPAGGAFTFNPPRPAFAPLELPARPCPWQQPLLGRRLPHVHICCCCLLFETCQVLLSEPRRAASNYSGGVGRLPPIAPARDTQRRQEELSPPILAVWA